MLEFVDIKQGTNSMPSFSNGNTLPVVNVPFGMNMYLLQTNNNGNWFYNPMDQMIYGIRISHQPSPWIGDYGFFNILPFCGDILYDSVYYGTSYRPEETILKPNYIKLNLQRYHNQLELTPCERGANLKITYSSSDQQAGFLINPFTYQTKMNIDFENNRITGFSNSYTECEDSSFAIYFVIEFDSKLDQHNSGFINRNNAFSYTDHFIGENSNCVVRFEDICSGVVNAKISTSFINEEQALLNLARENNMSFEDMLFKSERSWEKYLSKIKVYTDNLDLKKTFYTCLYRMFCFPQKFYELDADNRPIHYNTFGKCIEAGILYTNNGFWDTYKTVYPLYSIIAPDEYSEMLQGYLNSYKETGFLPKWLSPDERGCMPGTLIDAVIADACVKGIAPEMMDELLAAMIKSANTQCKDAKYGRHCVNHYIKYGYVPFDKNKESVNHTLDYAYSDFCISAVAGKVGETELKEYYETRSLNYQKIFDKETGFMRSRDTKGEFRKDFDSFSWGGDYCEGSAWQNSFAVYHDFAGLISLYGSKEAFYNQLFVLFNTQPSFNVGAYGSEIHEMSEMASIDYGQFAISNQPSFHIPYLFTYAGFPAVSQIVIKQTLSRLFNYKIDGLPGDEDNGSLAGFFVFSSMGFYPVCPGTDQYVLGMPLFDKVEIQLPDNSVFTIKTNSNNPQANFIALSKLDGHDYTKLYITHNDIKGGGLLEFNLSIIPNMRIYNDEELPFSLHKV
jgi:predicted alpha-1,2-mannosidase